MDIKTYVLARKEELKRQILARGATPKLVIIQVNDDFASDRYIKGKLKDAAEVGIFAEHIKLDVLTTEETLLALIDSLNHDQSVHGVIVQLPLPKTIREDYVKNAILPAKDVDGFHPLSHFKACTPLGIVNYLKAENIALSGKNAVVIGRSNIVGKPAAMLLLAENANVTILHSKTSEEDMAFYLHHADIIIVAVGIRHFLNHQELKKDAVVVDVGINQNDDGTLTGDARSGLQVRIQTPVPGGVGLLTRLTLLENVWEAYKHGI